MDDAGASLQAIMAGMGRATSHPIDRTSLRIFKWALASLISIESCSAKASTDFSP